MTIFYHPRFRRSFAALPKVLQMKTERRTSIFRKNPHDPRLDSHKLHGKLQNFWSFSIDNKYRILFEFDNVDAIFLDIGDHDLYR